MYAAANLFYELATGAVLIKALHFSQEIMWRKDSKGWVSPFQRALLQLLVAEPGWPGVKNAQLFTMVSQADPERPCSDEVRFVACVTSAPTLLQKLLAKARPTNSKRDRHEQAHAFHLRTRASPLYKLLGTNTMKRTKGWPIHFNGKPANTWRSQCTPVPR